MEHTESDDEWIENSPVGSSKNNGIVARVIQSVQALRSATEEKMGVKVDLRRIPCGRGSPNEPDSSRQDSKSVVTAKRRTSD